MILLLFANTDRELNYAEAVRRAHAPAFYIYSYVMYTVFITNETRHVLLSLIDDIFECNVLSLFIKIRNKTRYKDMMNK